MRVYDPRAGRFLSVDPLTGKYPQLTPYQYASNKPVWKRDIDGLEAEGEGEAGLEDDDLLRRADRWRESEALKTRPIDEELKDPARTSRSFRTWLNNYSRNGFNSAELTFAGPKDERDVTKAVDNFIARQKGLPLLNNSTAAEEEVKVDAALARITPGTVTGNGKAITGNWLKGTDKNAGYVPDVVAKQLRGQNFKSFDDFREAFWKAVANVPELTKDFRPTDITLMKGGFAPFALPTQTAGNGRTQLVYQLHHIEPVQHGGAVYDLDNIMVVTPKFHAEILNKDYHY